GIAGFIKTCLALKHGEVPPSLHFNSANAHIPFEQLPLRVVTERRPWPGRDRPALAGVSSFGFGGTNAHVVLESVRPSPSASEGIPPRWRSGSDQPSAAPQLLTLSARSPEALRDLARTWTDFFGTTDAPLADLAFTT